MLKLWYEREMDDRLGIETTALREWNDPEREQYYYRTESTPYQALDELFAHYRFPLQAHLVDFGCGTGRMAFYAHRYFNIPVTGIELNEETLLIWKQILWISVKNRAGVIQSATGVCPRLCR